MGLYKYGGTIAGWGLKETQLLFEGTEGAYYYCMGHQGEHHYNLWHSGGL